LSNAEGFLCETSRLVWQECVGWTTYNRLLHSDEKEPDCLLGRTSKFSASTAVTGDYDITSVEFHWLNKLTAAAAAAACHISIVFHACIAVE